MKLQKFVVFSLLFCFLFLPACTSDVEPLEEQEIAIGPYMFIFPPGFKHIPGEGLDSKVGTISNGKMSFRYDYGYYNVAFGDLPVHKYEITEDEFEGFSRTITRSLDHPNGYTVIYLYNIAEYEKDPYEINRLTLYASGLTSEEQELAISVFRSLTINH